MHILISQVGSPRKLDNTDEYERVDYCYRDTVFSTAMLGYGLAQHFDYDKLILIGTPGSAWDSVLGMLDTTGETLDKQLQLESSRKKDATHTDELQPVAAYLSQQLGIDVVCEVTPYIDTQSTEQSIQALQIIAAHVNQNDQVTLDVTHGMRTYPMLSMVISQYLRLVKQITIEDVVYGNFVRKDNSNGLCPVESLTGMLHILEWVDALNQFDKDGDYGVVTSLLANDGVAPSQINNFQLASFNERISASVNAKKYLQTLHAQGFDSEKNPLASFFEPLFNSRTDWIKRPSRGECEMALAEKYLSKGDYLRAAIYAQEGYISRGLEMSEEEHDVNDFDCRDAYRKFVLESGFNGYRTLTKLRNAMAHGLRKGSSKYHRILSNETILKSTIKDCIGAMRDKQVLD